MHTLRDYQLEALKASREWYENGVNRQLIAMATGVGRTVIFAALPKHHAISKRVLVLVHRTELAEQAKDKLKKWNPDVSVEIEMADKSAWSGNKIVVASVQTLTAMHGRRLTKFRPEDFGVVICDEAHHSAAASYKQIFRHFGFANDDNHYDRLLLGVTATPNRGDGLGLDSVYDEIVYDYSILDGIKAGWLVNLRGYRIHSSTSLDEVRTSYGDFVESELSSVVNSHKRNVLIVKAWLENGQNRQTIAFTVDIAHARGLADEFRRGGVAAEAIWGNDPDRRPKLKAHKDGRIQVLANCAVLTEGYGDWRVSCIVMARPTQSGLLFTQMVGRGTRIPASLSGRGMTLHQAKATGCRFPKEDCLILDVTDNCRRHTLVNLPTLFGLPNDLEIRGRTITEVIEEAETAKQASSADNLETIKVQAEQVDLFKVRSGQQTLPWPYVQWRKGPAGAYLLVLRSKEQIRVFKDPSGKFWLAEGSIGRRTFAEQFLTSEQAIRFVEGLVRSHDYRIIRNSLDRQKYHRR